MDIVTTDRSSGHRERAPAHPAQRCLLSTTTATPDRVENKPAPIVLPPVLDRARLVGVDQAAELLNFSVAHVRRLYRTGKMPKPVSIGGGKLGWKAGVLLDFIDGASGAM